MTSGTERNGTAELPWNRRDYPAAGGMLSLQSKDDDFVVDDSWQNNPAHCSEIPGDGIPCTSFRRVNGSFVRVESLRTGIRGGCWREAVNAQKTTPEQLLVQLGTKGPQALHQLATKLQLDCCTRCRKTLEDTST